MAEAYLVEVVRSGEAEGSPVAMRYAALADRLEQAMDAVRPLLREWAPLRCKGETLSPEAARALGLRRGQARLV